MTPEEIEILIIDDEEIWREGLADNLTEFGFKVAGKAATYNEAIELLNTVPHDLVLVDIGLDNGHSGISIGKQISEKFKKPYIYVTAERQMQNRQDVIASNPSAYILKPANPISLVVAIQNAINNFSRQLPAGMPAVHEQPSLPYFFVKSGSKYKKIDWNDVVYLRSEQNYTRIYNASDKQEYSIRVTLTKMMQYIVPQHMQNLFVQINRAEAIHLMYVVELNGDQVKTPFNTMYVTGFYSRELRKRVTFFA